MSRVTMRQRFHFQWWMRRRTQEAPLQSSRLTILASSLPFPDSSMSAAVDAKPSMTPHIGGKMSESRGVGGYQANSLGEYEATFHRLQNREDDQ